MNEYINKSYIKEKNLKLIKNILLDCGLEEKDDKGFHYLFKIIKSNKKIEQNIDYHNICDSIEDSSGRIHYFDKSINNSKYYFEIIGYEITQKTEKFFKFNFIVYHYTGTKYEFCINFPEEILIENDEEMFKNMVLKFLDNKINILEEFATFEEYNKINELLK